VVQTARQEVGARAVRKVVPRCSRADVSHHCLPTERPAELNRLLTTFLA
jgi:hypothetical protein